MSSEREDNELLCRICGEEYCLRPNCEPTDYCDQCAQELVPDLLAALQSLVKAVKEPTLQSMGFDHPPEYATAEDDALARTIFEARAVIEKAVPQ